MPEFTKTERKIIAMLADGRRHRVDEMEESVLTNGEYENKRVALQMHISNIRKLLRPIGQDIICQLHSGKKHYIHVRLIGTGE